MASTTADRDAALLRRLARLGIRDEDLEESFVRSGGKGGQNVNKVATCVVLRHRPTGIVVKCQEGRTQAVNRSRAREILADRIEERAQAEERARKDRAERARRRRRPRPKALKERILATKHARSETKRRRGPVRGEDD